MSLQNQYNLRIVSNCIKQTILRNILIGKTIEKNLEHVPHQLMNRTISSLEKQYQTDHQEELNTPAKKNHAMKILSQLQKQIYDFKTKNVILGLQLNHDHFDFNIKINPQDVPFKCSICQSRYFKERQHLLTHEKSCLKKINDLSIQKDYTIDVQQEQQENKSEKQSVLNQTKIKKIKKNWRAKNKNKKVEQQNRQVIYEDHESFIDLESQFNDEKKKKN